eukprot:COSAG01_NODE_4493_length_4977_cov_332.394208_2_plen_39_part_00
MRLSLIYGSNYYLSVLIIDVADGIWIHDAPQHFDLRTL